MHLCPVKYICIQLDSFILEYYIISLFVVHHFMDSAVKGKQGKPFQALNFTKVMTEKRITRHMHIVYLYFRRDINVSLRLESNIIPFGGPKIHIPNINPIDSFIL